MIFSTYIDPLLPKLILYILSVQNFTTYNGPQPYLHQSFLISKDLLCLVRNFVNNMEINELVLREYILCFFNNFDYTIMDNQCYQYKLKEIEDNILNYYRNNKSIFYRKVSTLPQEIRLLFFARQYSLLII